jgi:uncharacterized protein (TIGR02265 family)
MGAFGPIDWDAPLELEARVAAAREDASVKGLFITPAVRAVTERGGRLPPFETVMAFKDYPVRRVLPFFAACAQVAYPELPLRAALRRIGRGLLPAFRDTLTGKVMLGIVGRGWDSLLRNASRIYSSASTGRATVSAHETGRALLELRNVWVFPDCVHVGMIEGAWDAYGLTGEVQLRMHALCDVDLELSWGEGPAADADPVP